MPTNQTNVTPFAVKDCALIAIATGKRAQNLRELRDHLQTIPLDSIYYHFWGSLLRPRFDEPEYHNDFAIWAGNGLHDKILAERLSLIDPADSATLENVRQKLLEIIEDRLDELEYPLWARRDEQFEFIRSQLVIFHTHHTVEQPKDFVEVLPHMSPGSVFYHFVDARCRNNSALDDFQNWLKEPGDAYGDLCQHIREIDPYFLSLSEVQSKLVEVFSTFFKKGKK
jgi:hypothetical protein